MTKPLIIAAALVATVSAGPLQAEIEMRHGLWQTSFSMKSQSGEMEKQLREMQQQMQSLPPEQRKMMEQMLASQGISFSPDSQTIKVCISKERARLAMVPQPEDECSQKMLGRTGNTVRMSFTCKGNPPSSGESEVTFNSPTSYTGKTIINTTVHGKPEKMTMQQRGKWLSYDCGNIKAQ